ncbi:unnamed protein product [Phytomonas sp. EM1]|nr:unnamed protein product [Phytomonas sp. EM1]|eukprot:CCW60228.1 unnamed protein product [Phytomonas sp. isolate EM1]
MEANICDAKTGSLDEKQNTSSDHNDQISEEISLSQDNCSSEHMDVLLGKFNSLVLSSEEYQKYAKSEQGYMRTLQKALDTVDIKINGSRPWDVKVHHPLLYRRVLRKGSLGLGEAYMDGWWDTNDFYSLHLFFKKILEGNLEYYFPNSAKDFCNVLKARLYNFQTKKKSKRVGIQHYDLGSKFFEEMLGKSMQYSCAYWVKHDANGNPCRVETLDEAQEVKLKMIGDKLKLKKGMEVLDVGCGWGTLAKFLSERYDVKVVGITISQQQYEFASEYTKDDPNVTILVQDYRDVNFTRKFNRIVSVGMFEHVGYKNYSTFFKCMRRLLKNDDPDARLLLHTIGGKITKCTADQWYLKYIFPGGCLPSIMNIGKSSERKFVIEDIHNFGFFYGPTLMAWREHLLNMWRRDVQSRLNEKTEGFFRMFYYYLSSSAGAFLSRDLQLWQIVFSPNGLPEYPDIPRP